MGGSCVTFTEVCSYGRLIVHCFTKDERERLMCFLSRCLTRGLQACRPRKFVEVVMITKAMQTSIPASIFYLAVIHTSMV